MPYSGWFREKEEQELGRICRYGDTGGDCLAIGSSRQIQLHSKSGLHIEESSDAQFLCTKHHQGGVHALELFSVGKRSTYGTFLSWFALNVDPSVVAGKGLRRKLEVVRRGWYSVASDGWADSANWNERWAGAISALTMKLRRADGDGLDVFRKFEIEREKRSLTNEEPVEDGHDLWGEDEEKSKGKAHYKLCGNCKRICTVDGNAVRRKRYVCTECTGKLSLKKKSYEGLDRTAICKLLGIIGESSRSNGSSEMGRRKWGNAYRGARSYVQRRLRRDVEACCSLYVCSSVKSIKEFLTEHSDLLPVGARVMSTGLLRCGDKVDSVEFDVRTVWEWSRVAVGEWSKRFSECFDWKDSKCSGVDTDALKAKVAEYHVPTSASRKAYQKRPEAVAKRKAYARKRYEEAKLFKSYISTHLNEVAVMAEKHGIKVKEFRWQIK